MGLFGRRKAAEQALGQALAECQALRGQVAAAESARQEVAAERDRLRGERDDLGRERDELRTTVEARDRAVAAAEQAAAEATAREAAARSQALAEGDPGPSWPLLLADMQRRWANTVGVQPADRAMKATDVAGQLAEALDREVERVREEVGVDVSIVLGGGIATPQPVVFLLAATDLLGAMVATFERVALEVDDGLVMVGEVWSELGDDLEVARQRAVDAGLVVDPVDVDDERVRVTLHV